MTSSRPHFAFGALAIASSVVWHWGLFGQEQPLWSRDTLWILAVHGLIDAAIWSLVFVVCASLCAQSAKPVRALLTIVWAALVAYVATVRTVDFGYYAGGGWHLDLMFVEHAHGDLLDVPLTDTHKLAIGIASVVSVGMIACVGWIALRPGFRRAHSVATAPAVVALILGIGGLLSGSPSDDARWSDHRAWPEVTLPFLYLEAGDAKNTNYDLRVTAARRRVAQSLGMPLDDSSEFAFIRDRVYERELDALGYERIGSAEKKPNVIAIFFEAFSAAITSTYAPKKFAGLTPTLDAVAEEGWTLGGFYNSATPTMAGIASSFASHLSLLDSVHWDDASKQRWNALPRILGEHGYDTTYLHPVKNSVMRVGDVLRRFGFDRVIGRPTVERDLGEKAAGWGLSDRQMFRFMQRAIARGDYPEPFFFSVKTMNAHPPYTPTPGAVPYRDGESLILNAVHNSDLAFGEFWEWFRTSSYAENTIVVILSDHAMVPGTEYRAVRLPEDDVYHRVFDEIPFVVWNPIHRMRGRHSGLHTQLDFAPTVLHLCGINVRNHFEGHSVFETPAGRAVAGSTSRSAFVAWSDGEIGVGIDRFTLGDTRGAPDGAALDRSEFVDFLEWKRALLDINRMWDRDSGVTVDAQWIAARIRDLGDDDSGVRAAAAEQLGSLGVAGGSAVEPLLEHLEDPDPTVARAVSNALGAIGPAALPALLERLRSEDPRHRLTALLTIGAGSTANASAASEILAFARDRAGQERLVAVSALIRVAPNDDATITEVTSVLRGSDRAIALMFLQGLGTEAQFGGDAVLRILPVLTELLDDEDARAHVVPLLERLGPRAKPAVPTLARVLGQLPLAPTGRALAAIGPAAAEAVPAILAVIDTADAEGQRSLATALGMIRVNTEAVRSTLRALLDSPNRDVVESAQAALADVQR